MVTSVLCAGMLGLTATAVRAADGILIVQKITTGSGAPVTNEIQIEPRRMRAETSMTGGGKQVVIFDGAAQVMRVVDDAKKSYMEITKADIDAISNQLSAAMAQLPPEQRAQFEAMMRGRGGRGMPGAAAPAKVQYRKTGTDTVGKWTCDKYEGTVNGEKTSEICTVDPKVLGFAESDFAITKDVAAMFSQFQRGMGQMFSIGTVQDQGFSGVPVRSKSTVAGRETVSEISDVKRQSFADSIFQVPAGYQKQSMPMGRRGRQ
jgi:hypothetical protein